MDRLKEMTKLIQQYIITTIDTETLPEIKPITFSIIDTECIGVFQAQVGLVDSLFNIHYNIDSKEYIIKVYNKINEIKVNNRRI